MRKTVLFPEPSMSLPTWINAVCCESTIKGARVVNESNNGPIADAGTTGRGPVSLLPARPDEHRKIAREWIGHALDSIREMHQNEAVRQAVARRLF
jgi:hypothetical protein